MPMFQEKHQPVQGRLVTEDLVDDIAHWCGGEIVHRANGSPVILVPTPNATVQADIGMYVVCDRLDQFYVWKAEPFHSVYEEVWETTDA